MVDFAKHLTDGRSASRCQIPVISFTLRSAEGHGSIGLFKKIGDCYKYKYGHTNSTCT
jgi:hypothetical protein